MLVEHHGVGVPVQLLETQPRVVLPLDLLQDGVKLIATDYHEEDEHEDDLDGLLEQVPDVLHIFLVHGHREGANPHLPFFLRHSTSWVRVSRATNKFNGFWDFSSPGFLLFSLLYLLL